MRTGFQGPISLSVSRFPFLILCPEGVGGGEGDLDHHQHAYDPRMQWTGESDVRRAKKDNSIIPT